MGEVFFELDAERVTTLSADALPESQASALRNAARSYLNQPSETQLSSLAAAVEGCLRTIDTESKVAASECDGVVFVGRVEPSEGAADLEGYSWLVSTQLVTPVLVHLGGDESGVQVRVRFALADVCVPRRDFERQRARGFRPSADDEWCLSFVV